MKLGNVGSGSGLRDNHAVVILNNLNLILTLLKNHKIKLKRHKCCYKTFPKIPTQRRFTSI